MADADQQKGWIEDIEEASKLTAKWRGTSIKPTLAKLTESLYENGALPDDLVRLIDLVVHPRHLDQATLAAIIRNLYPATRVPKDAVLDVIGCLGHGQLKPALSVQSHLLRWLIIVYHVLEEPDVLSRAYAVLFNLLDTAAIRPQLCHLLALITRRKHVRPYRIQAVLELSRQTGSEPALTGLLRVFKNYYPEIVAGTAVKGRAAAFKHPDTSWRERLNEIQEDHRSRSQTDDTGTRNGFRAKHLLGKQLAGNKSKLPGVHTLHAQETSITLEEIDSADSFVRNLEKIELPSQVIAVFGDPLLQKLMLLRPHHDASARVGNWIQGCITDVRTGDADIRVLLDVIEVLQDYVSANKVLPPIIITVFQDVFRVWNGTDSLDAILNVFSHIPSPIDSPLADWDAFYTSTLQPFEHAMLNGQPDTPTVQLILLEFYTTLLQNWSTSIFTHLKTKTTPPKIPHMTSLLSHMHTLASTLTQTSPSTETHLHMLDYLDATATLTAHPSALHHLDLTIPPPDLIYTLVFSPSPAILSRLSDTISSYKRGLESAMGGRPFSATESQNLKIFNGFLMDICNCIWRVRAFSSSDTNSQGCRVGPEVVNSLAGYLLGVSPDRMLTSAFGLSLNPALARSAAEFMREAEDGAGAGERHVGPVTQRSLALMRGRGGVEMDWQEYRLGVLGHLEEKGFGGVGRLMGNTMRGLMAGKGGSESKSK